MSQDESVTMAADLASRAVMLHGAIKVARKRGDGASPHVAAMRAHLSDTMADLARIVGGRDKLRELGRLLVRP